MSRLCKEFLTVSALNKLLILCLLLKNLQKNINRIINIKGVHRTPFYNSQSWHFFKKINCLFLISKDKFIIISPNIINHEVILNLITKNTIVIKFTKLKN